jgi:flavorubredoxin
MKSLIVYYSHYGNTAIVAHEFWAALSKKGEADIFEVQYAGGKKNIFIRFFYRFLPFLVKIANVPFDLKDYEVLCLGIPVLGAHPSSAILKYLKMLESIGQKKIICCYVFGVEPSARHCSGFVRKVLQKKGLSITAQIFIPWTNVHKEDFLNKTIEEAVAKVS